MHSRQPPAPDDLGLCRLGHVDNRQDVIGIALPMRGGIGIAPADIPQPVQPQALDRHEGDLARLGRARYVIDPKPRGKWLFAPGEGIGDRAFEIIVRVGIALQNPDIRGIYSEQQILMRLQMKRA